TVWDPLACCRLNQFTQRWCDMKRRTDSRRHRKNIRSRKVTRRRAPRRRENDRAARSARSASRFELVMPVLALDGVVDVVVDDPRQAVLVANHWQAVKDYLTGDEAALCSFHQVYIRTAKGQFVPLLDTPDLEALATTGFIHGSPDVGKRV